MKTYSRFIMIIVSMLFTMSTYATQVKQLPVFHAILFADTDDSNIGKTTELDLSKVSSMLIEAQSSLQEEMEFKYYIYPGNYCNPENLRRVINSINVNSNDVVFFYYSGHGVRSVHDTSDYPQMCLGLGLNQQSKMISVEGVDREIAKKRPRLHFTVSDCCNSIGENVSPKLEISKGPSVISSQTKTNYKKLFLEKSGYAIVTSSSKGETSSCNLSVGGFFTFCLMHVMEQAVKQDVTDWNVILENVYKSTVNVSSGEMHPVYDVQISDRLTDAPAATYTQTDDSDIVTAEDNLLPALRRIIDMKRTPESRLAMVNTLIAEYFSGNNVVVESIGKDGRTIVKTETSRDFAERLATEFFLVNFNIIEASRNDNGKIDYLRIHEIYRE